MKGISEEPSSLALDPTASFRDRQGGQCGERMLKKSMPNFTAVVPEGD